MGGVGIGNGCEVYGVEDVAFGLGILDGGAEMGEIAGAGGVED